MSTTTKLSYSWSCLPLVSLNSFLDLKIENERLTRYIRNLKQASEGSSQAPDYLPMSYTAPYGQASDATSVYASGSQAASFFGQVDNETGPIRDTAIPSNCSINSFGIGAEDDYDDHQRRKKFKKTTLGDDQRVCMTCGRTDSPEWRKGPHGPKTLCNACGLRWAKRTRRPESEMAIASNSAVQDVADPETEDSPMTAAFPNLPAHMMF